MTNEEIRSKIDSLFDKIGDIEVEIAILIEKLEYRGEEY